MRARFTLSHLSIVPVGWFRLVLGAVVVVVVVVVLVVLVVAFSTGPISVNFVDLSDLKHNRKDCHYRDDARSNRQKKRHTYLVPDLPFRNA